MKKTFLAKRNALLAFSNLSWGAVALLVALVVLALRLIAPNMFWKISSPVFGAADTLASASHTLLSGFNDTAALAMRNEQLAEQNNALSLENQALQQKVTGLLLLLGREKTGGTESGILARVVARPPTSPYDTLLLAAGTNIGITEGMGVFGAGGVLLGSIEATSADYSQAVLLSAPGVRSDAWRRASASCGPWLMLSVVEPTRWRSRARGRRPTTLPRPSSGCRCTKIPRSRGPST